MVRPVIKRVFSIPGALAVALFALLAPAAVLAAPQIRLLEQTIDRTVVRIEAVGRADWASFALAIPGQRTPQVRIVSEDSYAIEGTSEGRPEVRFLVSDPGLVRGTWTSSVHVALEWQSADGAARARSLTVAVDHPSDGRVPARAPEARPASGAFLNASVAARLNGPVVAGRAAAPFVEDTFARSPNWIRIDVSEGGIYALDYPALRAVLGAAVDLVDPASIRLLSAQRRMQPVVPSAEGSSWEPARGLREHAIHVRATQATLVPGDDIIMFLPGVEGWADEYDAQAHWLAHDENTWSTTHSFWLTWDEAGVGLADFDAPPLRMAIVDGTPTGNPDRTLTDVRVRTHAEQNVELAFGNTEDNWAWTSFIDRGQSRTHAFDAPNALGDSIAWVRSRPAAEINGSQRAPGVQIRVFNAQYEISDVLADSVEWTTTEQQSNSPVMFQFSFDGLRPGDNTIRVRNTSQAGVNGRNPLVYVDFFDLHWRSRLRPDEAGRIGWVVREGEATAGTWRYRVTDPSSGLAGAVILDTRTPFAPRWIEPGAGRIGNATIDFDVAMADSTFARFELAVPRGLRTPLQLERKRPRLLRNEVRLPDNSSGTGYDYLILTSEALRAAAEELGVLRRRNLEGAANSRVAVVELQDVFDQFGHGGKDPAAIRNYVKFLYEIDQRIRFLVLVGDANRDSRGILPNSVPDWCPTFVESAWPYNPDRGNSRNEAVMPFARDDWFVSLDDPIVRTFDFDLDLPDLAVGRLPAGSLGEAIRMTGMVREYEEDVDEGGWKNSILLAADDERGGNGPWETYHILEAEVIAEELLPRAMDRRKLYLTEYPNVGSARSKPAARQDFIDDWSAGQLIVHYIGHGSPTQLADEVLFRIEDVSALRNATKRALFLGFSCDVAIFDDPTVQSMSEALVLSQAGGAIATIAATYVTYVGPNEVLTNAFYGRVYPDAPGSLVPRTTLGRSAPIGTALFEAKTIGTPSNWQRKNDAKYVILGDPAVRLQSPEQDALLDGELAQRIRTGQFEEVDGIVPGMAGGSWKLLASESADSVRYERVNAPNDGREYVLPYVLPGNSFFDGGGTFAGDSATARLRTPATMRLGNAGRVRMLMEDSRGMSVGLADSLPVERGALDTDDDQGPAIEFENFDLGQGLRVGQELVAVVEDSSGVNVLGSVAANSILADFDESGVSIDFTDRFKLDDSSYTRGTVRITLPDDLGPGEHSLTLSAGDMVGNVSLRKIEFSIVEVAENGISRHAPFPNPFRDATRFVVEVTSTMPGAVELTLDLYSVGGAHVESLDASIDGSGRVVLPWEGRDRRGDELANGTYLYVVRARFGGSSPFTETATGRVVLMR
jgi:hypothetical protein